MESKKLKDTEFFQTIGQKGGSVTSERKTEAVRLNGQKGGSVTSESKARTAKANGRKGGRKPLTTDEMSKSQKQRRERYLASKNKKIYADL